jgi:predicted N-acetyltransferase YhbS
MKIRNLSRSEIPYIWQIDRSEVIDSIYSLRDGKLVIESRHNDMHGWPPGEPDYYTPVLMDCFDQGGYFWGAFEGDLLVGTAVLENRFIGGAKDTLQMKFLHVGRASRKQGLGRKLFMLAAEKAIELGAKKLYISSTPSLNAVNFYMRLGCVLATAIDPGLFELEPEDIHLEYVLDRQREISG